MLRQLLSIGDNCRFFGRYLQGKGVNEVAAKTRNGFYWLLLLPFIGTLIPSIYAKSNPQFLGMPYFYWYLIMWIILTGIIGGIVYFLSEPKA